MTLLAQQILVTFQVFGNFRQINGDFSVHLLSTEHSLSLQQMNSVLDCKFKLERSWIVRVSILVPHQQSVMSYDQSCAHIYERTIDAKYDRIYSLQFTRRRSSSLQFLILSVGSNWWMINRVCLI